MSKSKYCGITGDELANMLRKPSKYSKKEAEEIIEKAEELTPLEAFYELKKIILDLFVDIGDCHNNLKIIETELKDFEWLKSKISIDWFDKLPTDDKFRVMKIMGVEYDETYTK